MHKIVDELVTIRDFIRWGTSQFNQAELGFTHGMPDALSEAVYLCLYALNLPPDFSTDYFDCVLSRDEKQAVIDNYQKRIEQRKPAAYITNEAWFAGLNFFVDERVLIPRSPLAEVIQHQFSPWVEPDNVQNIADLCTGSGCIAIACAYAFEQAEVLGSDISGDALEVAAINREQHGLEQRLQLIQSDLYAELPPCPYDIIISNPPYVSTGEMQTLTQEFNFEPASGLEAGEDGLDIVIPILQGARDFLSDDGILVVEVGYSQPLLEECLPTVPFYWLDFEHGGHGVFLLTAEQLEDHQATFDRA